MTPVSVKWLTRTVAGIFAAVGLPEPAAKSVAEALVDADRRGAGSHGVMLVPMYVERIRRGSVSTAAAAETIVDSGAIAVLDAQHALGILTADLGMALAMRKARQFGLGAVTVRRSFHFGAAGRYARAAAGAGLIGVVAANTRPMMPAPGGAAAVLGNNPIAIGIPVGDGEPIVLDMALSEAALGKIRLAANDGRPIPAGWASDVDGRPTTDAAAALAGMLLPMGGHKGFGLALVVEVLTGVLSGGAIGGGVHGLYTDTSVPNDCAHFFLAIDPAAFGDPADFLAGVTGLADSITASRSAPGAEPVVLPGRRSAARYTQSQTHGVRVDPSALTDLYRIATELNVSVTTHP